MVRSLRLKETGPYLFVAPNVALVLAFSTFPLLYGIYLSVHSLTLDATTFVGLQNYPRLVRDPILRVSLTNTLYYVLGSVPLALALALTLAIGLNRRIPMRDALRSMYLLPHLISGVTTGLLWQWMYSPSLGILNGLLSLAGLPPSQWLQNPRLTMLCIILVGVWTQAGYYMVLYLAGLQSIPPEYYDAAAVDGAGSWQSFRLVTLPLIRPITYLVLIIATLTAFRVFDIIYVMTGGGPGRASLVLVVYMYQQAFNAMNSSYGATIGILLFSIVFLLTLAQLRASRA